eukprot:jgi/Tetstr1/463957/TSEL_008762.t1
MSASGAPLEFHLASMTYDPASDRFAVKCLEPGCPMSMLNGAVVDTPHSLYHRSRGPHGFHAMNNWAASTRVMVEGGGFETVSCLAYKHHRLPNGGRITRSSTAEIRAFLIAQLRDDVPCERRVVKLIGGAATIMYRVNNGQDSKPKRRITPVPVDGGGDDPKRGRFIVDDGGVIPPEARLGLEEFKAGLRTPGIVSEALARGAAEHGDAEHGDAEHGDAEHGDAEHGDAEHGDAEHGDDDEEISEVSHPEHGDGPLGTEEVSEVSDPEQGEENLFVRPDSESSGPFANAVLLDAARAVALLADRVGEAPELLEAVRITVRMQNEALKYL